MDILKSDYQKGVVKLRVNDLDDLWYLSHIIDAGDLVKGKTTRKIKIGDGENAKTVKKTLTLKVEVEKVEFHKFSDILRVSGKVREGPEDIPQGSYHTISLEENSDFVLEKEKWLKYQKDKLIEAAEKKYHFLICVFDREEAVFALSKMHGFDILLKLEGEVARKRKKVEVRKDFYDEIIKLLRDYEKRYSPESVIIASPAFFKDDLMKKITDKEFKKKFVLSTCGSVSENAIDEVLKRPELQEALKKSRTREEELLVEELLAEIHKEGLAVYGFEQVAKAVEAGAVIKLLVGDFLIQKLRQEEDYEKLDLLMKQVDNLKGEIFIISDDHAGGKNLKGLGGVAGLLRYKLEW